MTIKNLWQNFSNDYCIDTAQQDAVELIQQWNEYKTKIENRTLILTDYINTKARAIADNNHLPGYYLCYFLEHTTKEIFGSSKPGVSINYGIKREVDGNYSIQNRNNNTYDNVDDDDVVEKFTEIKGLLRSIIGHNIDNNIGIIENSDFSAKQILRKIVVLEHPGVFLFIYKDEFIDSLYNNFIGDNANDITNLGKNRALRTYFIETFEINDEDSLKNSILLSEFLIQYLNVNALADENTPNVILYGPPGTGKTYVVKKALNFICTDNRTHYKFIQFHPSFTYEDFIEGIKPKGVTKEGQIRFELVNGVFKEFCITAKNDPNNKYYFIVDEINRANVSSVFGESLVCLEKDYRHEPTESNNTENLIETQYSPLIEALIKEDDTNKSLAYHYDEDSKRSYFGVPNNVFFIGMMNDIDKNIDSFDLALRRRFKWIRKDCDYDVIKDKTKRNNGESFSNMDDYITSCKNLNKYISDDLSLGKSYEFGHSFFMKIKSIATKTEISKKNIENLFELYLRPTLKEYLRAIFSENELDGELKKALEKFNKI